MATPNPTRKAYLPPELLRKIFQHSSKTDLQVIRLRRCSNEVVIPILYDELIIRLDFTKHELARRHDDSTFGPYVKRLMILVFHYVKWPRAQYTDKIRKRCEISKVAFDQHLAEQSYGRYDEIREAHEKAMNTGAHGCLCHTRHSQSNFFQTRLHLHQ